MVGGGCFGLLGCESWGHRGVSPSGTVSTATHLKQSRWKRHGQREGSPVSDGNPLPVLLAPRSVSASSRDFQIQPVAFAPLLGTKGYSLLAGLVRASSFIYSLLRGAGSPASHPWKPPHRSHRQRHASESQELVASDHLCDTLFYISSIRASRSIAQWPTSPPRRDPRRRRPPRCRPAGSRSGTISTRNGELPPPSSSFRLLTPPIPPSPPSQLTNDTLGST